MGDELSTVVDLMLDFLQSKSMVHSEKTLRNELQLMQSAAQASGPDQVAAKWKDIVHSHNAYTSQLEQRLGLHVLFRPNSLVSPSLDITPTQAICAASFVSYSRASGGRTPAIPAVRRFRSITSACVPVRRG